MSRVATGRLLDASVTLDAADRALLNIWVNRGMNDLALARMTGLDEATVAARRVRIVTHLSATLGLPPETVRGTLDEAAASAVTGAPSGPNGALAPAVTETPVGSNPAAPAAPAELGTPSDSASRPRRWLWGLLLAAIVIVVIVVVAIVSHGSGGSAAPASHAPPSPTAAATRSPGDPLVVLPGGPAHVTGTALVTGSASSLRLHLSVSNLPAEPEGHDEIWLYNSIVYARDLGRLPAGESHLTLRLPPNARRFHWIDISFQPPGAVFHSGESLLRSLNPLFRKPGAPRP